MSIEKLIEKVLTESKTVKDIAKELATPDWDMKEKVWVKGDVLEIADTYWAGGERALDSLVDAWTKPNGTYASYFHKEYGITFELVNKDKQMRAEGKYKKLSGSGTQLGIVIIFVKIK